MAPRKTRRTRRHLMFRSFDYYLFFRGATLLLSTVISIERRSAHRQKRGNIIYIELLSKNRYSSSFVNGPFVETVRKSTVNLFLFLSFAPFVIEFRPPANRGGGRRGENRVLNSRGFRVVVLIITFYPTD